MPFGQIIIGPAGAGKSTYCHGMQQLMNGIKRKCIAVNLDPANENITYDCQINIMDLITLEDVMEKYQLGPNGGLFYCMQFMEKNIEWLSQQIQKIKDWEEHYFLFDLPGQVELFTLEPSPLKTISRFLEKTLQFRFCVVHLVDSTHLTDPLKYISILLLSLRTMIQIELPHVNVLSKIDLLSKMKKDLSFRLEFYTEVQDLSHLLEQLNSDLFGKRYQKLNKALVELIEEFSLVSFYTLAIEDKRSIVNLLNVIDKANGFVFGGLQAGNESIFEVAARTGTGYLEDVSWVEEKYFLDIEEREEADDENINNKEQT